MKNYEQIKQILKTQLGIVTYKELMKSGISKYYIAKLTKDKMLEKITKGVYIKPNEFDDEYFILQQKYKSIVFSYSTALYFLNETEKTPENIDITIYKGYNTHRLSKKIQVHYVSKEKLDIGKIETETPFGYKVKSYNLERTICDLIKNKNNNLDKEQINKLLHKTILDKKIDSSLLVEYSKKLKCEKKIRNILDILM